MEVGTVLDERPSRGFTIGIAALVDDLAPGPSDEWAGSAADLAMAARLGHRLSTRLARAGRLEQAWDAAQGVVRIYRRLALREPARYRAELALALTSWGLCSSRLGRRQYAAAALTDSVGLHRELIARCHPLRALRRVRLRVGLAVALSNLGLAHSDLGRHLAAAAAAEEAVLLLHRLRAASPLYRLLARGDQAGFEHSVAGALNNLGVVLAEQGQRERALRLATETVEIYRRLTTSAPGTFGSELGRTLHNLGLASAELGRYQIALTATRESVDVHRWLARTDSDAFGPHLGRALCSFALVRAATASELDAALAAAREAVGIHEKLVERLPEAFSGDLRDAYQAVSRVRAVSGPTGPAR